MYLLYYIFFSHKDGLYMWIIYVRPTIMWEGKVLHQVYGIMSLKVSMPFD